jgi:IS30 family transposase
MSGEAKDRGGQITERNLRDNRPTIVEEQVCGATVEGGGKQGYSAALMDKRTKLLWGKVMANQGTATLNSVAVRAFRSIPGEGIKTLMVDKGKAFTGHKGLSQKLGCALYFAHPYHSWERGLNEHPNGLLGTIYPKGLCLKGLRNDGLTGLLKRSIIDHARH